jgi:hypothetical protein
MKGFGAWTFSIPRHAGRLAVSALLGLGRGVGRTSIPFWGEEWLTYRRIARGDYALTHELQFAGSVIRKALLVSGV